MMCSKLLVCVLVFFACQAEQIPQNVSLIVTVTDESGEPVRSAEVAVDGISAGDTGESGRFETSVCGPEGRNTHIEIHCPPGWLPRGANERELSVRFLRPIGNLRSGPVPMKAEFECVGRLRRIVLLVRTDGGQGLAVSAMGREIGIVNSEGVTQTVLVGAPGEEVEVSIDTSSNSSLRPSMPTRRLVIPNDSQIIVFDQKFETKKRRRRTNRKQPRKANRPRRI